jgi:hypothetical protein
MFRIILYNECVLSMVMEVVGGIIEANVYLSDEFCVKLRLVRTVDCRAYWACYQSLYSSTEESHLCSVIDLA